MTSSTLFIPDISGFTRFVKSTEITHSKHIIEELINLVIKEGSEYFEVAEIEGDAVFFYKHEQVDGVRVEAIAKSIYVAFHRHLLDYEHNRICNCGACTTATDLQLKFVTHVGEIEFVKFGHSKPKPFGDPVIVVHRLLKNEVNLSEYLLFTTNSFKKEVLSYSGSGQLLDKDLGEINFQYQTLDYLKKDIVLPPPTSSRPTDLNVSITKKIPMEADDLFQLISDLKYRKLWNMEASKIIYDEGEINQVGAVHYCVVKGKNLHFTTFKPEEAGSNLAYGEILKNPKPLSYFETSFLLSKLDHNKTELTLVMRANVKWRIQRLFLSYIRNELVKKGNEVMKNIIHVAGHNQNALKEMIEVEA